MKKKILDKDYDLSGIVRGKARVGYEAYFNLLKRILVNGKKQANKKANNVGLMNETLTFDSIDIDKFFKDYKVARRKLAVELDLYNKGVTSTKEYRKNDIVWWDYVGKKMVNTYPSYFKDLPELLEKIGREKRQSKNYVLFIGDNKGSVQGKTNQLPCLSLIQFQIDEKNKLHITVYQRSADANLGLPSDIFQISLIGKMMEFKHELPLGSITFFIGNAHIYENNIQETINMLSYKDYKFNLNV